MSVSTEFLNNVSRLSSSDRQRYVDLLRSGAAIKPFGMGLRTPEEMGFTPSKNPEPLTNNIFGNMVSKLINENLGGRVGGKTETPEAPVAAGRINFTPNTRVVGRVDPVATPSPAYKKGGLVKAKTKARGCGKAVKGHGKGRMY